MGKRPIARRRNKNPTLKVSRKPKGIRPSEISFGGAHPLIKQYWNPRLTLRQNYQRMGLVASLGGDTGGSETRAAGADDEDMVDWDSEDDDDELTGDDRRDPKPSSSSSSASTAASTTLASSSSSSSSSSSAANAPPSSAADAEIPIAVSLKKRVPTLPINVAGTMEEQARTAAAADRQPHPMSENQMRVFQDMIAKHGTNIAAIARDRKVNKYQFSEGQLRKKLRAAGLLNN
ncbi:ribosome biogenesis protein Nop16 [Zopfochytrium polystomum]|nr:ribosome biogenesis protein Nop16 [Zopfochytrium polystomum]